VSHATGREPGHRSLTPEKVARTQRPEADGLRLPDAGGHEEDPAQAKSLICLKCHTANATFNLHNWNASTHNMSDVSCSDCTTSTWATTEVKPGR